MRTLELHGLAVSVLRYQSHGALVSCWVERRGDGFQMRSTKTPSPWNEEEEEDKVLGGLYITEVK